MSLIIIILMIEIKNFLIVIYGLPGSGKTKFSEKVKKIFDDTDTLVISGDSI